MEVTTEHIEKAMFIARNYGATKLLLFGSALDNPSNANDIDLAVDGVPCVSFFELSGELELSLKIPVDLFPLDIDSKFTDHIKKIGKVLF
jgi:predicted nucleotidyltransferase